MSPKPAKRERVRSELIQAGVTKYGLQKSESRALHDYLQPDEHVLAAIYGQYESTSAMMVATDKRLVFIDIRQFHNVTDEVSYDMFGDISMDEGIVFSKVNVRTRPRSYTFTMVNKRCARRFLNVVEKLAIDPLAPQQVGEFMPKETIIREPQLATPEEINFLHTHSLATLSSKGLNGYPYGATVYYFHDKTDPEHIYHITKTTTSTAMNLRKSNKVSFTITDIQKMMTMHITGDAVLEKRNAKSNQIIGLAFEYQKATAKAPMPPIAQIKQGGFVVYKTLIKSVDLRSYN